MSERPDPLAPYAPIRSVGVPHAPFDGLLARAADGDTVLLVDREELSGWAGWDAPSDDHVLAPLDVVRRADGHDVVLPLVTERLDRFLARRAASAPLTDGEHVTLAVSVLRGLCAALDTPSVRAQWWLTGDGRPVVVLGLGEFELRRASAEMLTLAAEEASPGVMKALAELVSVVEAVRRTATLDDAESDLFALAVAEPLATEVLAPTRAVPVRGVVDAHIAGEHEARPWWLAFASRFDGELSETIERLRSRRRRASGETRRRRRLPVLLGAAVATIVIAGGLLWPDAGDAGAEPAATSSAAITSPAAQPPAGDASVEQTPEEGLARMLDARRACTDEACRMLVLENPARVVDGGAIDLGPELRAISLIDDLGGLVVLRVEALDGSVGSQLVTIVDTPNGWRVRDVFDVTDPP